MRRARNVAWAASIAVVLADSSIVTLALPEILREYDTTVFGVSWVLTAYNIVLAAAIIPAARFAARRPAEIWSAGLLIFCLSSLGCALAPGTTELIIFRCMQALGGAMALGGAIELLSRTAGSHEAGAKTWGAAGTAGLALGPALGGFLTELLSWEAIFILQVPLLILLFATREPEDVPSPGPEGGIDWRPEFALAAISAALTAALFLLVVLLTEGWGLTPIGAAAVVSTIPVATLAFSRLRPHHESPMILAIAGTVALAGGLAALGVIPGASPELTVIPQVLVGAGLAMALPVLTTAALSGHDPDGLRASRTISARHAGIVVGILLLTPILTLQLEDQEQAGRDAGAALLLDSPLDPLTKVDVTTALGEEIDRAEDALPDVERAFAGIDPRGQEAELAQLEAEIDDQLDRAATHAFSLPFIGAAALALLALFPLTALHGRPREAQE